MQAVPTFEAQELQYKRTVFAICPTGAYCREDRCQSYFKFDLIPTMRAPLEECESAGAITACGGSAFIIDGPAGRYQEQEFLNKLSAHNPDLIIIVVTFGTLDADLRWAEKLRKHFPEAAIGVRGAPCYTLSERILKLSKSVDFCVRGEYELIFQQIVKQGYIHADGVVHRDGEHIFASKITPRESNLDLLPRPDRTSIDQSLYSVRGLRSAQATIRVQRGCPYPCSYCLVHTVSGSEARHRSPESIVSEMKELIQQGISCFYLRAETFSLNKKWTLSVCKAISEHCPQARWVTTTRAERVDDEILSAMKKAGCYGISFGLDVASPTIGKKVNKLADKSTAQEAIRLCNKHGIISLAYLMIGFLWETQETLNETAQFIKEIRPDLLTIHFAHPYPGTKYYEEFNQSSFKVISSHAQAEPATATEALSPDFLKSAAKKMLIKHYARPSVLFSLARKGIPLLLR